MSRFLSTTSAASSHVLSVLRIVVGLLFLEHGTAKVLGFPPGASPHLGFDLHTMAGVSGILELVGGALLTIGLFTRLTAFILCGEMAVAYFMVHWALFSGAPHSFYPIVNKGEPAVLYCFVFLYFSVAGPGPWSLDGLRRRA